MVSACVERREEFLARRALIDRLSSSTNRRQPIGACDADLRLGFQDSRCCNPNVVVLLESSVDQVLKLLVLKQLPPFLVTERFRRRRLGLLRYGSAVRARNVYARSFIVGPDSAARSKEHNEGKSDKSFHVSPPPMGWAAEERGWERAPWQRLTISPQDRRVLGRGGCRRCLRRAGRRLRPCP